MKVLHVTNYDNLGGAGIAAHRLHMALRKVGVDSRMLVRRKGTNDPTVEEVGSFTPVDSCSLVVGKGRDKKPQQPIIRQLNNCRARLPVRARGWLGAKLTKALGMEGCSLNIFPTGLHKVLNASDADVIHLHWINNEMISIKEIAKINKPIVWTLHDMWPLCGAEHFPGWATAAGRRTEDGSQRTKAGDQRSGVGEGEKASENKTPATSTQHPATGVALHDAVNRWIYRKKMQSWQRLHVHFVAPSNWMAEQVRQSVLFANAPVAVIPNCLDLEIFQPLEQSECRKKLGLPLDKKLILFGAFDPLDPNKGLDLLEAALKKLPEETRESTGVVVFGCRGESRIGGLETFWLGKVSNDWNMAEVYNAGDLTCVPSRRESFGYTAAESLACGVPVVAFRTSGLIDIVDHQESGWLADPFDTEDLVNGISWVLEGAGLSRRSADAGLSKHNRTKAQHCFANEIVVRDYLSFSREVLRAE
ncbi:MAG: glycosyltransferase [Kiritimatiellales bacterium]|nr:glycosyltransferase [Kiritimatiellota bacterium]MBL7016154.1 glycosyltransferase [Kiritimatiellales bacterium]